MLERAKWDIAGAYLADWVSYETRPDIAFNDSWLDVDFPKFDPLGTDPHPDWLKTQTAIVTKTVDGRGAFRHDWRGNPEFRLPRRPAG